jgi:hypothetical protein
MSATLSKDLRKKHGVRSMPIRKDDEVSILKGIYLQNIKNPLTNPKPLKNQKTKKYYLKLLKTTENIENRNL